MRHPTRWAGAYALIAAIVAIVFAVAILVGPYRTVERSDYVTYQTAARIVLEGRGDCLYVDRCQARVQRQLVGDEPVIAGGLLPYNSPPWLAMIVAPLGAIPLPIAFAIFTLASLSLLALAAWRLAWGGAGTRVVATLVVLTAWPTVMGGIRGQSTIGVAGLLGLSAAASLARREGWSGLHLGLAALKPTLPAIWVARMLFERRWRTLAWAIAVVAVLVAMAAVVVSPLAVMAYPRYVLDVAGANASAGVHVEEMINWRGAAVRLGAAVVPFAIVGAVGTIGVVLAAWWLARRSPRAPALGAAIAFTATPLVIWHANQHEAILAILGVLIAVAAVEDLRPWLATGAIAVQAAWWIGPALSGEGSAWLLFGTLLASLGVLAVLSWREGARYFRPVPVPPGTG